MPTWATILLICTCTVAWPFVLITLIGRVGGWVKLARRYPGHPAHEPVDRGRLASIQLQGIGRYNRCITWTVDDDHLHLRAAVIERIGHPPISIPWAEVELHPARAARCTS